MIQSLPAGKKRFITRYRVGVSVLLAAAAAIMYVGFTNSVDRKTEETQPNQFVTSVQPAPNELALRQARVVARLGDDYTGVLIIDNQEIPKDQLEFLEGLSTVAYTPGEGKEIDELVPGRRCATVVYWPLISTREASAESYKWCWTVH